MICSVCVVLVVVFLLPAGHHYPLHARHVDAVYVYSNLLQQVMGMAVVRVVVVVVVNVMVMVVVVGAAVQVKVAKMGRRTLGNTTTMANTTNTKPFFTNANDFISTKE